MSEPARETTTEILERLASGDHAAAEELLPLVYTQLRNLADYHFRGQPSDHTLQPTALVHEAYLRVVGRADERWNGRAHFFAVASTAMRQILINHARGRAAARRGGGRKKVTLNEGLLPAPHSDVDLLALNDALTELSALSERMGRIVELRFFGGLTVKEVAEVLEVSKRTVEGDWELARAWLARALDEGEET